MKDKALKFIQERDFNVRVSVLDTYSNFDEEQNAYVELVRDSLGGQIVNNSCTFIGNYISARIDKTTEVKTFQSKGKEIISKLKDVILNSSIIRINIRLIQGGYKSWVIARSTNDFLLITMKDFNVRTSVF